MKQNTKQPNIKTVRVMGTTSWSATTYKTVGRFRGSREQEVVVRDEKGKPCMKPERLIHIFVICADGVSYRFTHSVDMRDEAGIVLYVHGMQVGIGNYAREQVPVNVQRAYDRARLRVKACLRIMRNEVAALPKFRPLPVAK